jgi:hypothetical protein
MLKTGPFLRRVRRHAGAATLATLMVLLLLMGMTTVLGARLLLGDLLGSDALVQAQQRQSLNESGLDWGLQLLNGPTLTQDCQPAGNAIPSAALPMLAQVTEVDTKGHRRVRAAWQGRQFQCVHDDDAWHCQCPVPALARPPSAPPNLLNALRLEPLLVPVPAPRQPPQAPAELGDTHPPPLPDSRLPSPELHPGFSLAIQGLERPDAARWRRRTMRLVVQSCARGQLGCRVSDLPASSPLPASVQSQLVVLASALPRLPGSALVARAAIDLGSLADAPAGLAMPPDAHGAWAVQAGGPVRGAEGHLQGPPGSATASLSRSDDPELAVAPDAYFQRFFGLPPAAYRVQPGVATVDCSVEADCSPVLAARVRAGQHWLWIRGPLRLRTPVILGRLERPVLLICDAALDLDAPVQITGLLYSQGSSRLQASGPALRIDGAVLSAESSELAGQVQLVYSASVLRTMADQLGTWIRLPGGWGP